MPVQPWSVSGNTQWDAWRCCAACTKFPAIWIADIFPTGGRRLRFLGGNFGAGGWTPPAILDPAAGGGGGLKDGRFGVTPQAGPSPPALPGVPTAPGGARPPRVLPPP